MATPRKRSSQKGIVLITTLLMVAVLSLLVASMLMDSGTQQQMSFNAQSKNQTFQAADSALSEVVNDDNAMFEAIDNGVGGLSTEVQPQTGISRLNSEGVLTYQGEGIPVGTSLNQATTYKFEAEGRGFIDDNGTFNDADDEAKTRLLQGVYRISYVKE